MRYGFYASQVSGYRLDIFVGYPGIPLPWHNSDTPIAVTSNASANGFSNLLVTPQPDTSLDIRRNIRRVNDTRKIIAQRIAPRYSSP